MVVVPPRMLMQRAQSYHGTFAEKMSTARNELTFKNLETEVEDENSSDSPGSPRSPVTPDDIPTADSFAFAFDIDGVLIRGGRPIPEAVEAMRVLNGENEFGVRV